MPLPVTAKWEPAKPQKKDDTLIACEQFRFLKPFKPSYEEDEHVYINWILAWQYGKLWIEEHKNWEKMNFGPSSSMAQSKAILRRKYVKKVPRKHN